jgi:hypothetical protein
VFSRVLGYRVRLGGCGLVDAGGHGAFPYSAGCVRHRGHRNLGDWSVLVVGVLAGFLASMEAGRFHDQRETAEPTQAK